MQKVGVSGAGRNLWLPWALLICVFVAKGVEGWLLCLCSGEEILDGGGQRLDFPLLYLIGCGESSNLRPEYGVILGQGSKAVSHCGLYFGQGIFQVIDIIVVQGAGYQ